MTLPCYPVRQPEMTRRPSILQQTAEQIRDTAARIAHQAPTIEHTLQLLRPHPLKAASTDPGRASTHSDPTAGVALTASDEEFADGLRALQDLTRWLDRYTSGVLRQHPETVRAVEADKRANRCSDPTCWADSVRRGMCWPHYRDWLQGTDRAHSTPSVLKHARLETGDPVEHAPRYTAQTVCLPCGATFTAQGDNDAEARADALQQLGAHQCEQ